MEFEKMTVEYIDPKKLKIFDYSRRLFPELQGEAYEYLKQDIQENGIRTPLEVTKEGLILCGHERQRVALELGLKEVPIIRFNDGSEVDQKIHLIKDNLARKAVDNETRAECAVELDILYGLKHGEQGKTQNRTEDGKFAPNTPNGNFGEFLKEKDIAEQYNVSERNLQRGKRIKTSSLPEEIKHAAFHGPLSLNSVDLLLAKPKEVQEIAVPKILDKLKNEEEGISIEKITSEITEELETEKELEKAGVPSVNEQVEQFYGKIKASPHKQVDRPIMTTKGVIRSVLLLLEKNQVTCPVCGEKYIQWKCGHEFE